MKILFVAWSIYDDRIKSFSKLSNGGGLVIRDLCEFVGREEEVYLFIGKEKLPEMQLGNIHVVGREKYPDFIDDTLLQEELKLQTLMREFENTITEIKPDIVSIQGIGEFARRCIIFCMEKRIPCVFTEHLYIGIENKSEDIYERVKVWEKSIYTILGIHIIAVSHGMKKKILKDFPQLEKSIKVISNGTDFKAEKIQSDLKERYQLEGKRTLICSGTICERKNQMQIIRAFKLLPEKIQKSVKILFCGTDRLDGKFQKSIIDENLEEQLIYVGNKSSEEMKKLYSVSDGLIMPSYAEGLSIAALENIAYGQPVILFRDSECTEDLNDENVVQIAETRSDGCLTDAIIKWYEKEWDSKYIIKFSKYFSMERMAEDYITYYRKILDSSKKDEYKLVDERMVKS